MLISVSSAKKTHVFRKGCHFCDFCENDARFPWVELIDFPNNSVNFHEKTHKFTKVLRKAHKFTKYSRKTHIFRKRMSFLRILRKWRTFPMSRICSFSQDFTKFQRKTLICIYVTKNNNKIHRECFTLQAGGIKKSTAAQNASPVAFFNLVLSVA